MNEIFLVYERENIQQREGEYVYLLGRVSPGMKKTRNVLDFRN